MATDKYGVLMLLLKSEKKVDGAENLKVLQPATLKSVLIVLAKSVTTSSWQYVYTVKGSKCLEEHSYHCTCSLECPKSV